MKITAVEAEVWRIPLPGEVRPAWAPGTVWREKLTTVYRVETDAGLTGIGAGQGSPQLVRDRVAPRLVGQDPFATERIFRVVVNWGGGAAAVPVACGIEMALWDLVGKAAGLPLYKLWGYARALATCRELAPLGVVWMEEPLGRFEFDTLRRLAAASEVAIAGGENNVGLHEFRLLIDQNCYDIVQPDAAVSAGLGALRKVAAYAELRQKPFVPHHGGSGLGVAAHLHLSASCPNSPYVELLQEPPALPVEAFQGLIAEPLVPDADGNVRLPAKPGLGVDLNPTWERVG